MRANVASLRPGPTYTQTRRSIPAWRSWPCRGGCALACVRWTCSFASGVGTHGKLPASIGEAVYVVKESMDFNFLVALVSLYVASRLISSLDGNHLLSSTYILFAPTSGMSTSKIAWFLREKDKHNLFPNIPGTKKRNSRRWEAFFRWVSRRVPVRVFVCHLLLASTRLAGPRGCLSLYLV